jgi:hypothetical protein
MTWPLRMSTRLPDGRTLITEVSEDGDAVTLWFVDQPDQPIDLSSVAAMALGQALARASAITGQRCATPRDQRSRARGREELARRIAHAVEIERQRRSR